MKKLTRRLSTALILVLIFSICFTLVNFAQESAEGAGGANTPPPSSNEEIDPSTSVAEGVEDNSVPSNGWETFLEAVKTIVGEDFVKVGSMVIEIALLILMVVLRKTNKTTLSDIVAAVSAKNKNGERVSVAEIVSALTNLAEANEKELMAFKKEITEKLKAFTEAYSVQTVTHEQVKEIAEATKAMLQMFHAVYSHSKTIGANVKDEEGQIYNEAMKHILALESEDPANDKQA